MSFLTGYFFGLITFIPVVYVVFLLLVPPKDVSPPSPISEPRTSMASITKPVNNWLTIRRKFHADSADGWFSQQQKLERLFSSFSDGTLRLFEDEQMTLPLAEIELSEWAVDIYPEGLKDGELYSRRNAIRLRPKAEGVMPYFIFLKDTSTMEDMYHMLVLASNPSLDPNPLAFSKTDVVKLIEKLDCKEDLIPTRWLNALLGRIFFSLYRTQMVEDYIIRQFRKKLTKVKRPAFLDEIKVLGVSVGDGVPILSKPMLKELTADGTASVEVHVSYTGSLRIEIGTTASLTLPAKLKSYSVDLVLAVVLKSLEGTLLLKIKSPPSSRIWYGFTSMPEMDLSVEPVVSQRQIKWAMILNPLQTALKDVVSIEYPRIFQLLIDPCIKVAESIVLPNMDDFSFFDSSNLENRGGIYSTAARSHEEKEEPRLKAEPMPANKSADSLLDTVRGNAAAIASATSLAAKRRIWFSSGPTQQQSSMASGSASFIRNSSSETLSPITSPLLQSSETMQTMAKPSTNVLESTVISSSNTHKKSPSSLSTAILSDFDSPSDTTQSLTSRKIPKSSSDTSMSAANVDQGVVGQSIQQISSRGSNSSLNSSTTPSIPSSSQAASSSEASANSVWYALKAKAADKQALAASLDQAKDSLKKWGVSWNAKRKDGSLWQSVTSSAAPADQVETTNHNVSPISIPKSTSRPRNTSISSNVSITRSNPDSSPSSHIIEPSVAKTTTHLTETTITTSIGPDLGLIMKEPRGKMSEMVIPGIEESRKGSHASNNMKSHSSARPDSASSAKPPHLPPRHPSSDDHESRNRSASAATASAKQALHDIDNLSRSASSTGHDVAKSTHSERIEEQRDDSLSRPKDLESDPDVAWGF